MNVSQVRRVLPFRTCLLALLLAPPLLPPAFAAPPAVHGAEKKPFSDVIEVPDEALRPLLPRGGERLAGGSPSCIVQQCDEKIFCFRNTPDTRQGNSACLLATFPDVQWRVCIYATAYQDPLPPAPPGAEGSKGLFVGPVDVRRPNDTFWRRVLYKAGNAEVFTPYHAGTPRLYDTQFASWDNWRRPVTPADAGPNGALVTLAPTDVNSGFGPTVVAECRDRGPAWLCKGNLGSQVRRGQAMVLWGVLDAGNYDFITEYGFRDDGAITFRTGATGYNLPGLAQEAHMHDVLWRLDVDLNGPANDRPFWVRHLEGGPAAQDDELPFLAEGSRIWNDLRFNALLVEDGQTNFWGNPMGYELEPERVGTGRHSESWTQRDAWVSRWHAAEEYSWAYPWTTPDTYLGPFTSQPVAEPVSPADVVLWYIASTHHEPHDEDRDAGGSFAVTLAHWFGFTLEPHNLFDANPLGAPPLCP
jgi:primary-amine oxidase